MRTHRKLLASLVVIIYALAAATTQHAASPIYYQWVTRNSVYLWQSETDPKPLLATQGRGGWTLAPPSAKTDSAWLEIARANVQNLAQGADPWTPFLARLRDEQPNNDWAKVRKLNLQVYLRARSPERALITFVKEAKAETIVFTKKEGKWSADKPHLLSQLAGADGAEVGAVLGLPEPPRDEAKLVEAWGAWIVKFGDPGQNPAGVKLSPVEAGGRGLAVWQERMTDADWNRRMSLLEPALTPSPSPSPPPEEGGGGLKKGETVPFYMNGWLQLIAGLALAALLTMLWALEVFPFRRRRGRGRKGWLGRWRARRRLRAQGGELTELDGGDPLDLFCEELLASAENRLRDSMSKLRTQLGMDGMNAGEASALLQLGKATRDCFGKLMSAQRLNGDASSKLYPDRKNKLEWLSGLPESFSLVTTELGEKSATVIKLGEDVKAKNDIIAKQANELQLKEQERTNLLNRQTELTRELEKANDKVADTQAVIDGVVQAAAIAKNFQQGLRYYSEKNDLASAAIVSALVNYSLSRLCHGYAEDNQELVDAMLVNLYNISTHLKDVMGFTIAAPNMEKNYTGIKSLEGKLATTNKGHTDDEMFRLLLKHLFESARIDLGRFYFDVDQEKRVHYASPR
jgi:hypothetical protein